MNFRSINIALAVLFIFSGSLIMAEDGPDEAWKKEMERKIEMLARERGSVPITGPGKVYEGVRGFAPAASKVYHVPAGVSIGGYGEMIYNKFQSERDNGLASGSGGLAKTNTIDFVRNILYVGYKFNDKFVFNSELEFEHGSTTSGGERGEVSVEFAQIDFSLIQNEEGKTVLGARTGLLLVPSGLRNELHEPTLFHGTARPSTEKNIIPSTWRDNGVGLFGETGPIEWRTYVMAPLQGVDTPGSGTIGGFTSSGLRGGRSKGAKSHANDKAWIGRVDVKPVENILVGGSVYIADTANDTPDANGQEFDGRVSVTEIHAEAQFKGAEVSALYAKAKVDDVERLNDANGITGSGSIGEEMFGGYISIAFDILSLFENCNHYLAPFYRFERYDTQQGVPTGMSPMGSTFSESLATDVTEHTFGLSYKPHPQIVIKADVQNQNNKAGTGIDSANLGIGFLY